MAEKTLYANYCLASGANEVITKNVKVAYDNKMIRSIESVDSKASSQSHRLLLPPLSNAHDHGRGLKTLAYGVPDQAVETWVAATYLLPAVDPYLVAVNAFSRMVKSGIGSVVHCHLSRAPQALLQEGLAVKRAANDVGMRVAFVVPLRDKFRLGYGEDEAILAFMENQDANALRARLKPIASIDEQFSIVEQLINSGENELFQVQLGPVSIEYCTQQLLERIAESSANSNRRVHMHLLESKYQRERADKVFPGGVVRYLDELGMLSPRLTIAHGTWLRPEECELLAERGVLLSVNTSSNLRLRSGVAPLPQIHRAGLPFALGLDALALDDDDDLMREMRLTRLLHAGTGFDDEIDSSTMLHAACHNGASAAGAMPGTIAEGAPADLLLLNLESVVSDLVPDFYDIYSILHARATSKNVDTLVIAGRTVVSDGKVLGVDDAEAQRELTAQLSQFQSQLNTEHGNFQKYRVALEQFYKSGGHTISAGS